jgi:MFS family permease
VQQGDRVRDAASTSQTERSGLAGLAVLGLGASIVPLDFAVNVAFPAITDAFAIPTHAIRWVAVCYVLTYGALMIGFGALGDRIGYLRVFRAGLALGAVAFAGCALAPSYPWLLAARALQGVAVALTLSCAPALATLLVDASRRTWALSAFAGTQAIAGVAAPIVGGAAVAALGWPGVYAFRVPIVLAALACSAVLRPAAARQAVRADGTFDATGSALLAAALGAVLLVPTLLGSALLGSGGSLVPALAAGVAAGVAIVAFARRQRASATPFVPRGVSRDARFALVNLGACVVQFACFAVPLTTPYFLLRGHGWGPWDTGLMLSLWALGTLAGSWVAARAVPALGARRAALAGAAAAVAGLAGLASLASPQHGPHAGVLAGWLLLQGAGLGLFQVAHADLVVAALPVASRGVAGSLAMVTRTVGVVFGATVWMGLLQAFESAALAQGTASRDALVAAYRTVTATAAGVTVAYFALSSLRRGTWAEARGASG